MKKIFNSHNMFVLLMIASTLLLAGSAAYYSVFGLSSLFAGAKFEVIILAGGLEFSKLVVASYLHNHWKIAGWMKYYLCLAVFILMVITSVGIYGFLTAAYQKTSDELMITDKKVAVIELKKDRFQTQLDGVVVEKEQLNTSILELSKGLSNNVIQYKDRETGQIITTTSSSTRRALQKQLDDNKEILNKVSQKVESLTDSVTKLDFEILDIQSNNEAAAEIGPLRYLSKLTGKSMDVIVNWFTLLIVFVFDPLAIAMVIALNKLTGFGKPHKTVESIPFEIVNPIKEPEPEPEVEEEVKEEKEEPIKEEPKPDTNLYNEPRKGRYSDGDNANTGK